MSAVDASMPLQVGLLGPLLVVVDGSEVDVPGPRRRAVLVLLALAGDRTVPLDDLVDALWPGGAPESGRSSVHTHVSRLRAHLGPAAGLLQTTPGGYRLELGAGSDVARVRALLASARSDDPGRALESLRRAHNAWRGPVLADLTDVMAVATGIEELAHLRRDVTDALVGCALEAGRAGEVLDLAVTAHASDPLREPAVLLLMRSLAATGQSAEALRVGREHRRRLVEETGLDPSRALGDLEREIAGGGTAQRAPRVNPRPVGRIIGREVQIASLHRLLAEERLVTVVGTGGVGKTRLALEVVEGDPATTVVLLAPVSEPDALPHALAAALDLDVVQGDVMAACVALLSARPGVLLVDNCEHLTRPVGELVSALLAACPDLVVLATSREPLGVPGEHTFRLSPLPLAGPAVEVFLDRAARVRPGVAPSVEDLEIVADIVRRLDGLPLAIELAASRLSAFSLQELDDRLDRALDLLGGERTGLDARHRTLRTMVAWSYELLTPDERRLLRHVAVFPDGLDLDTVEWVAHDLGLDGDPGALLSRLVDASLLEPDFTAVPTRYRMLETLRTFGLDRLAAANEEAEASARLQHWGSRLATSLGSGLASAAEARADRTLRRELANLRAAWRLGRRDGPLDDAATIVVTLFSAIAYRDLVELRTWAEELAGDPGIAAHPLGGGVLVAAAESAYHRGDLDTAERQARAGEAIATGDFERWAAQSVLMAVDLARGRYAEVVERSRRSADLPYRAEGHGVAALAAAYSGDLDLARTLCDDLPVNAPSPTMRAWAAYVLGEVENAAGDATAAGPHYRLAVDLARDSGATFVTGIASVGLLTVLALTGRVREALSGYREVVDYFTRTGNWTHLRPALRNLADLVGSLGDDEAAAFLTAVSDESGERLRRPDVLAVARQAIDRGTASSG